MKNYSDVYDILRDATLTAQETFSDNSVRVIFWTVKYIDITILSGTLAVDKNEEGFQRYVDDSGFIRAVVVYNLMPDKEYKDIVNAIDRLSDRILEKRMWVEGNILHIQDSTASIK